MEDFKAEKVKFTIGTEDKMDMSLDDIISKTKVNEKKPRRPVGKKTNMRTQLTEKQRKQYLARSITEKARDSRRASFQKNRGLQNNTGTEKSKVIRNINSHFAGKQDHWKQQKMRKNFEKKKLTNKTGTFSRNVTNQNQRNISSKPIQNRPKENDSTRRITTRMNNRNLRGVSTSSRVSIRVGARGRTVQIARQSQQRKVITNRRGLKERIQSKSETKSLNERFSTRSERISNSSERYRGGRRFNRGGQNRGRGRMNT